MTSSGHCQVCNKIATTFRYNYPRLDPDNINDGRWLCEEHDDRSLTESSRGKPNEVVNAGRSYSRALKREEKKKSKIKF
jgi:hypothetical protein